MTYDYQSRAQCRRHEQRRPSSQHDQTKQKAPVDCQIEPRMLFLCSYRDTVVMTALATLAFEVATLLATLLDNVGNRVLALTCTAVPHE